MDKIWVAYCVFVLLVAIVLVFSLAVCGTKPRSPYTATLSVDKTQVKVGEIVKAQAELKNTGSDITVSGGGTLFIFGAQDTSGNPVDAFNDTAMAKQYTLNKNTPVSESYDFKFDKAGTYTIMATAVFNLPGVTEQTKVQTQKITIAVK